MTWQKNANLTDSPTKIIYDVDDVLWGLNGRVAGQLGIPLSKISDFDHSKTSMTATECQRFWQAYEQRETFIDMEFFPGIERLLDVEKYGVEVYIDSCACSKAVVEQKYHELRRVLPEMKPERMLIHLLLGKTKHAKQIGSDTLIFVDDGPHNVAHSQAKYNIVPRWPWNANAHAQAFLERAVGQVIMVDSLAETLDTVERLVRQERGGVQV